MHTAFPAEVVEYDAARQTVDVQPVVRDFRDNDDGAPVFIDRPLLHDVPVGFPRGGGFHLTLPIAKGDHVLVICSEQDTLIWRQTGRVSNPGIADRHQINGCFALPCGYPDTKPLDPPPSADDLVISSDDGASAIVVKQGGEVLAGDATASDFAALSSLVKGELDDFKSDLDGLKTALEAHTHTGVTAGTGSTGTSADFAAFSPHTPQSVAAEKTKVK